MPLINSRGSLNSNGFGHNMSLLKLYCCVMPLGVNTFTTPPKCKLLKQLVVQGQAGTPNSCQTINAVSSYYSVSSSGAFTCFCCCWNSTGGPATCCTRTINAINNSACYVCSELTQWLVSCSINNSYMWVHALGVYCSRAWNCRYSSIDTFGHGSFPSTGLITTAQGNCGYGVQLYGNACDLIAGYNGNCSCAFSVCAAGGGFSGCTISCPGTCCCLTSVVVSPNTNYCIVNCCNVSFSYYA